ncbi:DHA2 family efflux MFS transporter permease subunit [Paenibacillus hexagrammi]|uniref:DHA2 family efflux MFS transporter permease subunit n=1 Tax=Paenibacillus hexagrammi TaxID=2908839 RepID=A0ABY3SEZ7_9BACL|nr:DHA2 family efflux MFS transporter permease subunit [Paenibacillus sp. YPD9-1]UJF31645.1 DHA2 family efflux MFS transporter permease subunit [Paenibacillus sp. YPD9-1]
MNAYVVGYVLFSLLILLTANWMFTGRRRRRKQLAEGRYSPIPEPSPLLVEMSEELNGEHHPNNDSVPHTRSASPRGGGEIHVGQLLTVLMLGAFVAILNQTLINVAIPHIMMDFNVTANVVQWLTTGYMLVNGVMIPITAFLIERFGSRFMFLTAMILFTVGALVCALAPNFPILMSGRVIQAAGAGIIMPLMMTVFLTVFLPEKRGSAMGTMGIAMIFAPAIGPTLSGWLVQTYTWRLLFYIVLPIGLLDIILAFFLMGNVTKMSKVKFDFWGFLFSTVGFGGLLFAFSEAGSAGWLSFRVLGTMIVGILSLIAFVWRELTAQEPMIDLRVFTYNVFTLTTIVSSIINMAMFAAMILLPIYLQNIRGFTPLASGLLLLPGAILMGIMQPISGMIFDRIGARWLAVVGLIITTITTWEFSKLTADTPYAHILLLYCLRMFGMSFMMMTIMTEGMNQLPRHLHSHGTAMSNTLRQVAGSLGTALLVTVMSSRADFHMGNFGNTFTSTNPSIVSQLSHLSQGFAVMAHLPVETAGKLVSTLLYATAMKESTINGINDAFIIATAITAVALVLSFFISRVKNKTNFMTKSPFSNSLS